GGAHLGERRGDVHHRAAVGDAAVAAVVHAQKHRRDALLVLVAHGLRGGGGGRRLARAGLERRRLLGAARLGRRGDRRPDAIAGLGGVPRRVGGRVARGR